MTALLADVRHALVALRRRPVRIVLLALQGACFTLVGFILFGILRLPTQLANIEALPADTGWE